MNLDNVFGERIHLVTAGDWGIHDMYEYSKLPEFYKHMGLDPHKEIDDTKKYVNTWYKKREQGTGYLWFVFHRNDRKVIGSVALWDYDKENKSTGFGYGLSPLYHGKGYMNEALVLLFKYIYYGLRFHKMHGLVTTNNIPSMKVVEKFGFAKEGVLREHFIVDGKRRDAIYVGMFEHEFARYLKQKNISSELKLLTNKETSLICN